MAIYPGAVFKPTSFGGRTPRNKQGRGILHVGVSRARSLPPWNGNTWHFWVALDGYCEQYVDTDFRAYASGDANDDAVHIETAGGTGTSPQLNAEEWTPAQAARIADIMRWEAGQPGGAPLDLLPDSRAGRRGWGPHRLGVTHSRGLGAVPGWRVPGGESWSSSIGKECPGDAKVRQIPNILALARGGATTEDDMPLNADDLRKVEERAYVGVLNAIKDMNNNGQPPARAAFLGLLSAAVAPLQGQIANLAATPQQTAAGSGQLVDPAAVAAALVASPEFVDAIGKSVAANIADRLAS